MINQQGAVHLLCLHPQCLLRGSSNKRLLGQTPLRLMPLITMGGKDHALDHGEQRQAPGQLHPPSLLSLRIGSPVA